MADVKLEICGGNARKLNKTFYITFLFHVLCCVEYQIVFWFGIIMVINVTEEQLKNPKVWEATRLVPCFLTNWNVLFQTTFLFLALTHDVLEWLDKHESKFGQLVRYWRDIIFSGLAVPVTLFVTGMFWTVYAIDRELVFPTVYDDIVPWWFNHCVHTNILIIVVLETLLQPRRRPVNEFLETTMMAVTVVSYAVVYYSIYFIGRRWLYQVFAIMTWWQVCLFQLFIWASSYAGYLIQFPINRLIHGSEDTEAKGYEKGQHSYVSQSSSEHLNDSETSIERIYNSEKENSEVKINGVNNINGINGKINGFNNLNGGNGKLNGVSNNLNENGDKENGVNGVDENDFKKPSFADRSWSLKYRTLRSQFEKTSL